MIPKDIFNKYGALHVKDVVSQELANFLTHVMLRSPAYFNRHEDEQVPGSIALMSHEVVLETLLEKTWHKIENVIEEELIPTYSYGRVYTNGNILEKHKDRPSCEVSVTVQLARSHHYAWPIYMGNQRFDLAEGDGVIYKGCDIEHWRNPCDAPHNYYSGQVFLHYVRKNGPYADYAGDKRWSENMPFIRNRNSILENK
jgi:hypothetical protein